MAESNKTKKTIVFSSEKEKKLIDSALDILSVAQKKTPSYVLEDMILGVLLPENKNACYICRDLYLAERPYFRSFEDIFQIYAAGFSWHARYQNGREIVEYFSRKIVGITIFPNKTNEGERAYFFSKFQMIKRKIEDCEVNETERVYGFPGPALECDRLLASAEDDKAVMYIKDYVDFFLAYWEVLGDYTYTFRELCSLCRMIEEEYRDTDEVMDRLELIEIIKRLSSEWN